MRDTKIKTCKLVPHLTNANMVILMGEYAVNLLLDMCVIIITDRIFSLTQEPCRRLKKFFEHFAFLS